MFIDGDDYIEKNMIQELYSRLQIDSSDLAICNFIYVDEYGNKISQYNANMPIKDEILKSKDALRKLAEKKYFYYITPWNKLYHKDLFQELEFPVGKQHEDEFIAHIILSRCSKISCIKKPLYFYLQRQNSIMNSSISIKHMDYTEAFIARTLFCYDRNLPEVVGTILTKAFRNYMRVYSELHKEKKHQKRFQEVHSQLKQLYKKFYLLLSLRQIISGGIIVISPHASYILSLLKNKIYI